ncbi:MAG TPA: GYD domain-containing protein [Acidimicrobiales bacterium]|nr:GYD domain-containing protein [Acidimicrobiales bacterium]
MPKYLLEVNYTLDGVKGLKAEGGSSRVAAATALIEGLGGTVESFHFAFGGSDVYVIADMPDNAAAAAASLAVSAGGGATARTVVLLTAAELDAAAAKRTTYRPPGT